MIDKLIGWFEREECKHTYSMAPPRFDCSSSVYNALIEAGFLPQGTRIGNTDTLFGDIEANGWGVLPLDENGNADTHRGDIFIWGVRGQSGGAAGHTGVFYDDIHIWNTRYGGPNPISDNHDELWEASGQPTYTFYRYLPGLENEPEPQPELIKEGDTVVPTRLVDYDGTELTQYDDTYTVTELIGDRAVLSARGQTWAAMNVADVRKA